MQHNVDPKVVADFGREWQAFNHQAMDEGGLANAYQQYFHIFPFGELPPGAQGFDMGCGSGRWARLVAPKVGRLHCIDPSELALAQAKRNLSEQGNCTFECAPVSGVSLAQGSQDFGYCLGVLHHIPDTEAGIRTCVSKLKAGAPFLLYLYYRFDNRPWWFKLIWQGSDLARRLICLLPFSIKRIVCEIIAMSVYWPLSRIAGLMERLGFDVASLPLSDYRNKSYYFLRTDALDRFGTRLEKRFTRQEMHDMMTRSGLTDIVFSEGAPHWVAVGRKR